jgi:WhiB family redox-sensing transcriptional regulator
VTSLRGRDWRQLAACARPGVDPELFFPGSSETGKTRQAKRICADCAVKAPCLADALSRPANADHGIYGGTTPQQRSQIRRRSQSGRRERPSVITDPALAAEAFELARRIGTTRAAQRLAVDRGHLYRAWDQWHLGRPNWRGRIPSSQPALDPLAAQRAFQLAEQVGLGLEEAAERLGIYPSLLGDAWDRWGLGQPGVSAKAARRGLDARAGDRTRHRHFDQLTRLDVAEAATPRAARVRSGPEEERER